MNFQQGLNYVGQSLDFNQRQLIFNNKLISPNPRIKDQQRLDRRFQNQITYKEVIPYLEVHLTKQSLIDAGINQSLALAINSKWSMVDPDTGVTHELRLLLEPIYQAHRFILGFVDLGDESLKPMTSPYVGRENLKLFYDDDAGNPQTLDCWMHISSKPDLINTVIPDNSVYYKGRTVTGTNVFYMPTDYPFTRRVTAHLSDSVSGVVVVGEFISDPYSPPQYPAIDRLQGSKICGYFYSVGSGRI